MGELDEIAEKIATKKEKKKFFVDLESIGYTKLLGTGKITKPIIVKVSSYSKLAAEKIKEAGGEILAETPQESGE